MRTKVFTFCFLIIALFFVSISKADDWSNDKAQMAIKCTNISSVYKASPPFKCEFDTKSYEERNVTKTTGDCLFGFLQNIEHDPAHSIHVCDVDDDCRNDFKKRVKKFVCKAGNREKLELVGDSLIYTSSPNKTQPGDIHDKFDRIFPLATFANAHFWMEDALNGVFGKCDIDISSKAFSFDKKSWNFSGPSAFQKSPYEQCGTGLSQLQNLCQAHPEVVPKFKSVKEIKCKWGPHSAFEMKGTSVVITVNDAESVLMNFGGDDIYMGHLKKYFNVK